MSPLYKINCPSVPISILTQFNITQKNTVDVKYIANTRHQKWKDNVKNSYLSIGIMIHALKMKKQQCDCFIVV